MVSKRRLNKMKHLTAGKGHTSDKKGKAVMTITQTLG